MEATYRMKDKMTAYPCIGTPEMTVSAAYEFMEKCGFRHLPVMKDDRIVGVVSERDLKQGLLLADSIGPLVCDVMTPDPYCVRGDTPLALVAREMAAKKYGCTIVVDRGNCPVGIFTTTDGMRVLSEVLALGPGSSVLEIGIGKLLAQDCYLI